MLIIIPITGSALGTDILLVCGYVTLAMPYMYRAVDTGMRTIDVQTLTECERTVTVSPADSIPNKDFVLRYQVAGDQILVAVGRTPNLDGLGLEGAGIAFADKYRGEDHVTLCMMGDGAVRQGILHETFNMAMTWKLPVIFIIENNNYAMGTSVERTSNVHDLSTIGESYDMPGLGVNGMRCEDVHEAIAMACDHVRAGNGPYLLDIKTYRYKGHSMSDPQKYRTKEEVEEYKKQDPIEGVRDVLLTKKWATEAELDAIDAAVKKEVEEAVKFAEDSPMATA